MSAQGQGAAGGTPPPPAPAPAPAATNTSYALVGSYSTVQVISPTQIVDVVYCTIQTQPSNVVASMPVDQTIFDAGNAGTGLSVFAGAIESVMADPRVIAGMGVQTIDAAGLLADTVVFTVQYIDPVLAPLGATATAEVPVRFGYFVGGSAAAPFTTAATATIDTVYTNLQAAASG